jgi:L-glutamine-phosphate cytidylyltransferase
MKAVILAAGRGSRLKRVTGDLPKCLARIGGLTLIERQMRAITACGLTDIVVVTGHGAADVRRACSSRVTVVHNKWFSSTNSLYSLWLARHLLVDGFVVFNCDVLFHTQLLRDLVTCRYDDAILASSSAPDGGYTNEEMKVRVRSGRVVEISKTIPGCDTDAENVGIARFSAAGAVVLFEEMRALVAEGLTTAWLPAAFDRYCKRRALHVVDNRGFPWIEIDSPDDYWQACSSVLPALDPSEIPVRPDRGSAMGDNEAPAAWSMSRHV